MLLRGSLVLLFALILPSQTYGYYGFGKNKVQYFRREWQELDVGACRLYYPSGLHKVASYAAHVITTDVAQVEDLLGHIPRYQVPVVIYNSHPEFLETNILPFILPEGVGGFTEFVKGRVAIPNTGSYSDLRHVLVHEMTHAVMGDKLVREMNLHRRHRSTSVPLWFSEGLAEYTSTTWTAREEMVLADAFLDGRLPGVANLWKVNRSYLVYCAGHSLLLFMTETWGVGCIEEILRSLWQARDFEEVFLTVTGHSFDELTSAWRDWLGRRFTYQFSRDEAELQFTRISRNGGSYLSPAVTGGSADTVLAISYGDGYTSICALDPGTGARRVRKLLKAGGTEGLESLHLFRSRLGAGPNNTVAFVAKAGERDALYLMDVTSGDFLSSWTFDALIGLSSPSISLDGTRVAFSASDSVGVVDLYMLERGSGELQRLTNDVFYDASPCFDPDGRRLVFSSDRISCGLDRCRNLFIYDLEDGRITQLTYGHTLDSYPAWRPTGDEIAFVTDRGRGSEIWVTDGKDMACVVAPKGGSSDPAWSRDGSTLYFSVYRHGMFSVFAARYPMDQMRVEDVVQGDCAGFWEEPAPRADLCSRPYRPKYSLDLSRGVMAYDPSIAVGGGADVLLTDVLGDRRFYFHVSNSSESMDNFLGSFNLAVSYVNLHRRLNYGVGVFRLPVVSETLEDGFRAAERHSGTALSLSYPLSRFHRIEGGSSIRWAEGLYDNTNWVELRARMGYVRDTALWGSEGPWDGSRLSVQGTLGLEGGSSGTTRRELFVDLRRYLRITLRSTLALRGQLWTSEGTRPKRFGLGGPLSLRGWGNNRMVGKHRMLFNAELRYPLLDAIVFFTPAGEIGFGPLRGAAFVDAGRAWDAAFPGFVGSTGLGLRLSMGGVLVLRLDMASPTDFKSYWGRRNTQFFFGWSY